MRALIIGTALLFASTVHGGMEDAYNRTTDARKIGWMEKGMEAVKQSLKDPESADFRNVYFHRGADNIPMTCGEVNAANSFGGKTGFQAFISAGKPQLTFLQEQVEDFSTLWRRFCQ
jgi:hypothetical protein